MAIELAALPLRVISGSLQPTGSTSASPPKPVVKGWKAWITPDSGLYLSMRSTSVWCQFPMYGAE